ncbi:acyclic terpene utilization AtuA family protein [Bradyrhizobium sp. LTSPM299]|uniref:acyclic terpene utilization AtuA family protein n=1 Tax=Bradyrhizobium sp. LTSPM299 TaxID=1619233 RepID=UPI001FD8DA15|nr:acyclic terpene utilization AtuA family protein [Bradyrhizobium sp. LTSPM299]
MSNAKSVGPTQDLAFQSGEIREDGEVIITKVACSVCVSAATVKERLLYEIRDPASYYQTDVVRFLRGSR